MIKSKPDFSHIIPSHLESSRFSGWNYLFGLSFSAGRPCIRGMRIRVKDALEMLAGGAADQPPCRYPFFTPGQNPLGLPRVAQPGKISR
ncbi:MAG: DUF433 domain-containing protein [Verrucomicrobiota bacterium]